MKVGLVLAAVLVLTGCVAVPPPGPSEAEVTALNERLRDGTWQRTGLTGVAERPETGNGAALAESDWFDALGECMGEAGIASYGTSFNAETGFELVRDANAPRVSVASQLAFYGCVTQHPVIPGNFLQVLTDSQLDYVYDYYQSWLVPCVIMQGYTFSDVPTRAEFKALAGRWSPFYSVDISISGADYEELERICGPERPQLY